MRILHVVENWGLGSGGVYSAIEPLIRSLNSSNEVIVLTNKNTSGNDRYVKEFQGYLFGLKLDKTLFGRMISYNPDIVHIHGLWTPKSLICMCYARLASKKLIVSPHGMLTSKAFSKSIFKKLCVYYLHEKLLLKSADLIHMLNEEECNESSRFLEGKKIAIVANPAVALQNIKRYEKSENKKSILFLGRVSKIKGVLELIKGWIRVKDKGEFKKYVLDIVGWGEDFQELSQLEIVSDKSNRIFFHGPVSGDQKIELLVNAKLFVLPSFTEGLPMAVIEAIVCRTPVMISKHCNLNLLESIDGFQVVEPTPESIELWLNKFIKLDSSVINKITQEAYEIVMENYALDKITDLYIQMYKNA